MPVLSGPAPGYARLPQSPHDRVLSPGAGHRRIVDCYRGTTRSLANIPDGDGWRFVCRAQGGRSRAAITAKPKNRQRNPKMGYAFIHTVIDDHSRVAYAWRIGLVGTLGPASCVLSRHIVDTESQYFAHTGSQGFVHNYHPRAQHENTSGRSSSRWANCSAYSACLRCHGVGGYIPVAHMQRSHR